MEVSLAFLGKTQSFRWMEFGDRQVSAERSPIHQYEDVCGGVSVSLPADIGGLSLYILAQDTDRSFGATVLDTAWLDHLYFRSNDTTPA